MKRRTFYAIVITLLLASAQQLSAQNRQFLHEGWTFSEAQMIIIKNEQPNQVAHFRYINSCLK